jgi:hypothetical protein
LFKGELNETKTFSSGFVTQRTTAEKRANQDGWCRAKRRPCKFGRRLWDDRPTVVTKSWKDKRKTQHYPGGRGEHHWVRIEEEKDCRSWLTMV